MKKLPFIILLFILTVGILLAKESSKKESAPFSQTRFVPDIALIADFAVIGRSLNDETWAALGIPGFSAGNDSEYNLRGFNLRYAELGISAVVDPYFDLFAVFHLNSEHFEIEEIFARTRQLPFGLQLKMGKFLSHFGRLNSQHAHYWSFDGAPLPNRIFFGEEGLNELGGQLTWLTPLPFFLQLGMEVLRGENEVSFGCTGFGNVSEVRTPGLGTAFAKASWDIGRLIVLAGLSLARGQTRSAADPATGQLLAFSGRTVIWGGDLSLQYQFDSYRYLKFQAELLLRRADADGYETNDAVVVNKRQCGFYSELTWRFDQRWRLGLRLDAILKNQIGVIDTVIHIPGSLWAAAGVLDFVSSEFTRLRLQYCYDHSRFLEGERRPYHELSLRLNLSIGAHGAHTF